MLSFVICLVYLVLSLEFFVVSIFIASRCDALAHLSSKSQSLDHLLGVLFPISILKVPLDVVIQLVDILPIIFFDQVLRSEIKLLLVG